MRGDSEREAEAARRRGRRSLGLARRYRRSLALARRYRALELTRVLTIVSVLAVAGTAGTSFGASAARSRRTRSTVVEVEHLLNGIPQSGNVLGDPRAPVTLQVFSDLECPICKEYALDAQTGLIRRYVRTGKLKIVDRSLETATRETETFVAQQIAALAAGAQRKMWYFIELFYREQGPEDSGYVTEAFLRGLARQVPELNLAEWSAARKDPVFAVELASDTQTADLRGFPGTPVFLIGRTGGRLRQLANPSLERPSDFAAAIDRLLRSSARTGA